MPMSLIETTMKLGKAYKAYKNAETRKEKAKSDFFREASEQYTDPKTRQEIILARDEDELRVIVQRRWPDYDLISAVKTANKPKSKKEAHLSIYEVNLRENLFYRPFIFVNPEDGMVYSKSRVSGSPYIDEESLQEEDPDLYNEVTRPKTGRELIPLDQLPDATIERLKKYLYQGRPQMKLLAPRKAKPEELE
jgi:hypothetical protein